MLQEAIFAPPERIGMMNGVFYSSCSVTMRRSIYLYDSTREKLKNGVIKLTGKTWSVFMYQECRYDKHSPWQGLFRNNLIVKVFIHVLSQRSWLLISQAYKCVFTSPSSADSTNISTRAGNAQLHNMTQVTRASIAYIVTQVC
jgi:hypothetical protein